MKIWDDLPEGTYILDATTVSLKIGEYEVRQWMDAYFEGGMHGSSELTPLRRETLGFIPRQYLT